MTFTEFFNHKYEIKSQSKSQYEIKVLQNTLIIIIGTPRFFLGAKYILIHIYIFGSPGGLGT